jgi:hypothetical protein
MPRLMLLLTLISLSSCAGHSPAPPATERCLTLKDHLRCRSAEGKHFSEPYPGTKPRACVPVTDAEAHADWEEALRK